MKVTHQGGKAKQLAYSHRNSDAAVKTAVSLIRMHSGS